MWIWDSVIVSSLHRKCAMEKEASGVTANLPPPECQEDQAMRCECRRRITFFSLDFSADLLSLDLSRLCEVSLSLSFLPPNLFMMKDGFVVLPKRPVCEYCCCKEINQVIGNNRTLGFDCWFELCTSGNGVRFNVGKDWHTPCSEDEVNEWLIAFWTFRRWVGGVVSIFKECEFDDWVCIVFLSVRREGLKQKRELLEWWLCLLLLHFHREVTTHPLPVY